MRSTPAVLGCLTATCSGVGALSLQSRDSGPPRVVQLNLHRSEILEPVEHDKNRLRRRAGTVNATLDNMQALYFLNASIGTPPQHIRVHLDTGSSDLWVNAPSSSLCAGPADPCDVSGTYTANSSSTYTYLSSDFNITYVDGSGAAGDYATDTIRISGNDLADFQFGIGYESSSLQSVLGIGYPANEVQVAQAGRKAYANLPAKMVAEGLISSNAYSLWLDDLESSEGSILFGGVDRSRYRGNLVSLPIQRFSIDFSAFFITLTGLSAGSTNFADGMALGVLLDSGSSLTYLPNELVTAIYNSVNATFQETQGVAFIPCSAGQQNASLTFRFSDPASISVPLSELVLDLGDRGQRELRLRLNSSSSSSEQTCLFGIAPAGESTSVLGDTFLRSAYVVYDLDSNEISLAQSNFDATGADVVEITKGAGTLPSAVSAAAPVTAQSGLPGKALANAGAVSQPKMSVMLAGVVVAVAVFVGHVT